MTFNVAPATFTEEHFNIIIQSYLDAAAGLGIVLGRLPAENGWDQASLFDHDAGDVLLDAAMTALQSYAKDNQLFYNKEKLADACAQALVSAYGNGFVEALAGA